MLISSKTYFTNVEEFSVNNILYISGQYQGYRYMVSYFAGYIVTERVDGRDRYVGVCNDIDKVVEILTLIKDQQPIIIDELTKLVAGIAGYQTI